MATNQPTSTNFRFAWLTAPLLVFCFLSACYPTQEATGNARAVLNWSIPGPASLGLRGEISGIVDSVEVTVMNKDELLGSQQCDYEEYKCIVREIPAGNGRQVNAQAYSGAILVYSGTTNDVQIVKDETATVTIDMSPAYTQDTYAPAPIDDLEASANGTDIELTWTSVGDDWRAGQATSYDVRYSISEIREDNFDQATSVDAIEQPAIAGQTEWMPLYGLPAATYYIALKVLDDVDNKSTLSNVVTITTTE
jgi:hypothetical protein